VCVFVYLCVCPSLTLFVCSQVLSSFLAYFVCVCLPSSSICIVYVLNWSVIRVCICLFVCLSVSDSVCLLAIFVFVSCLLCLCVFALFVGSYRLRFNCLSDALFPGEIFHLEDCEVVTNGSHLPAEGFQAAGHLYEALIVVNRRILHRNSSSKAA
jgi:hypothetical protein